MTNPPPDTCPASTPRPVRAMAAAAGSQLFAVASFVLAARLLGATPVGVIRSALASDAVAPANAALITQGMAAIQGNWYWFLLVTIPLALAVLMGALGLGVRSASDWLFRLVMAVVGIIAFAPAMVA